MKKRIITVSNHHMTRCASCSRHHKLDINLNSEALLDLSCNFCGGPLIDVNSGSTLRLSSSRSSKLALGLLSASLAFGACDDDEEIIEQNAGNEMVVAGDQLVAPVYGAPAGEVVPAGEGVEAGEVAGTPVDQPVYGAPAAGDETPVAGAEMETAGEDAPQDMDHSPEAGAED